LTGQLERSVAFADVEKASGGQWQNKDIEVPIAVVVTRRKRDPNKGYYRIDLRSECAVPIPQKHGNSI
jgi:hypothetical protein